MAKVHGVILPWPSYALSPAAQCSWAAVLGAQKAAKRRAFSMFFKVHPLLKVPPGHLVWLEFVFIPPNRRRLSEDDYKGRVFYACQGVAQYLGIPDERIVVSYRFSPVPTPGGELIAKVRFIEAETID